MSHASILKNLIDKNTVKNLSKGSKAKTEITAMQNILKTLGYGKQLNWDKYGADGGYGGSSTAAVGEFLKRNKMAGDGSSVSIEAAKRMLMLYNIVDDLCYIQDAINDNEVEKIYTKGSTAKADIVAMQTVLHALGFGKELNWDKYGADGGYGASSMAAVQAFSAKNGLESDGKTLTKDLAIKMVDAFKGGLGDDWFVDPDAREVKSIPTAMSAGSTVMSSAAPSASTSAGGAGSLQEIKASIVGTNNVVTDGVMTKQFKRFRQGNFTYGTEKMADFINKNADLLSEFEITKSSQNVMMAVSENEGNMDAINTWDNCYMTFGMFQWTLGPQHGSGELPALLKKIKEAEPDVFQEYFGKYGLDVSPDTDNVYGYVILNGKKIQRAADKEQFRSPQWSFIFWRAGHNKYVKAIEVEHALSRLKTFYWQMTINDFPISKIITSEYGVGLILDNHVNRPGYVKPCIRTAMTNTGLMNPTNWSDADELRVINEYIKIRATYGGSPMTHANNRAAVTKKYVDKGTISSKRNSFRYSETDSRDAAFQGGVSPEPGFDPTDYRAIRGNIHDEFVEF
jgi:peptidoglycan hydrolase-like protein with peptidoglycan-binding domain